MRVGFGVAGALFALFLYFQEPAPGPDVIGWGAWLGYFSGFLFGGAMLFVIPFFIGDAWKAVTRRRPTSES